jgi:hypothetical protein
MMAAAHIGALRINKLTTVPQGGTYTHIGAFE